MTGQVNFLFTREQCVALVLCVFADVLRCGDFEEALGLYEKAHMLHPSDKLASKIAKLKVVHTLQKSSLLTSFFPLELLQTI